MHIMGKLRHLENVTKADQGPDGNAHEGVLVIRDYTLISLVTQGLLCVRRRKTLRSRCSNPRASIHLTTVVSSRQ